MSPPPRLFAVLAIVSASVGACKPGKGSFEKSVFGEAAPRDDVDLGPYLATARAIVTHGNRPAPPAPSRPGQRAFVTLWSPSHPPIVGTGIGDTLIASVAAAAEAVASEAPADVRLQLDLVSRAEPIVITKEMTESLPQLGLYGYLGASDREHVGFVLPTEVLAFGYFDPKSLGSGAPRLATDRLTQTLAARARVDANALPKLSTYRIATTSRVEASKPGRALPIFRSMPPRPESLTPAELIDAVRAGADYLERALNPEGRYRYYYCPVDDTVRKGNGKLRHAGVTYALLEAYEETREPRYLAKAELALAYLDKFYRKGPEGEYLTDTTDEEQQKVGGNGLALVAFAKHAALTGQSTHIERMQSLARFIVHQQYPDGHFRANADVAHEVDTPRAKPLKQELFYYAGEATLGLVRLYRIDPQPKWLAAARKSADFLVFHRDAKKDDEQLFHDQWLSYALLDLYRETQVEAYADHAFKIARAILKKETTSENAPAPDYAGTFYPQGETTPTSTRLEALAADLELSRYMGADHAWLDAPAMRLARFMRGQQFDRDSAYFAKLPDEAVGGVRESLLVSDIRIDYVQHAMSAWLHLARVLRDPSYGSAPASEATDGGRE